MAIMYIFEDCNTLFYGENLLAGYLNGLVCIKLQS